MWTCRQTTSTRPTELFAYTLSTPDFLITAKLIMISATSCATNEWRPRACWNARNTTMARRVALHSTNVPVCDASRWLFQRQVTDACQNQLVRDVPGSNRRNSVVQRADAILLSVFRMQWSVDSRHAESLVDIQRCFYMCTTCLHPWLMAQTL